MSSELEEHGLMKCENCFVSSPEWTSGDRAICTQCLLELWRASGRPDSEARGDLRTLGIPEVRCAACKRLITKEPKYGLKSKGVDDVFCSRQCYEKGCEDFLERHREAVPLCERCKERPRWKPLSEVDFRLNLCMECSHELLRDLLTREFSPRP